MRELSLKERIFFVAANERKSVFNVLLIATTFFYFSDNTITSPWVVYTLTGLMVLLCVLGFALFNHAYLHPTEENSVRYLRLVATQTIALYLVMSVAHTISLNSYPVLSHINLFVMIYLVGIGETCVTTYGALPRLARFLIVLSLVPPAIGLFMTDHKDTSIVAVVLSVHIIAQLLRLNDVAGRFRIFFDAKTASETQAKERGVLLEKLRSIVQQSFAVKSTSQNITGLVDQVSQLVLAQAEKIRLEKEIATAEWVQKSLIPKKEISLNALQIYSSFATATECGGDWWSCYDLKDGKSLIVLGDVTGHGTGSALVASLSKGYTDAFAASSQPHLLSFLTGLNQLLKNTNDGAYGLSALVILIDEAAKKVEIVSAGHPLPFIFSHSGEVHEYPLVSNPLLGSAEETHHWQKTMVVYSPGTKIFCYTDGLTDCINISETPVGEGRLFRTLKKNAQLPGLQFNTTIDEFYHSWAGEIAFVDDVTMITIELGSTTISVNEEQVAS